MPRKAAPKRSKRKEKPERAAIRYSFYAMTLILVFLMILPVYFYYINSITMPVTEALSSAALSLFFPFFAYSYMLGSGKNLRTITQEFGLTKERLTKMAVVVGVLLFLVMLAFSVALGLFSSVTNIQLPTNVSQLFAGVPIWFLLFSFLIAPIDEEIFFRGFLIHRPKFGLLLLSVAFLFVLLAAATGLISLWFAAAFAVMLIVLFVMQYKYSTVMWTGIIISALIFALSHLSYLSISEFAAALFFGLIAGYVFEKRKSLYSTILAHALVNFLTVISLLYIGMYIHI